MPIMLLFMMPQLLFVYYHSNAIMLLGLLLYMSFYMFISIVKFKVGCWKKVQNCFTLSVWSATSFVLGIINIVMAKMKKVALITGVNSQDGSYLLSFN